MTKRYIRVAVALTALVVMCTLGVICASATSTPITPALNRSDLYSMAEGAEDQCDLQTLASIKYIPILITNTSIADQDYQYFVYAVYTDSIRVSSYTQSSVTLTTSGPVYRFDYDMYGTGLNNLTFVTSLNTFTLRSNEQVALYLPALGGWSYGVDDAIGSQPGVYEDLAFTKWRNAMEGYQGVWNGVTIGERVETARENGYNAGLADGKEAGYNTAETKYLGIIREEKNKAYDKGWNEAMNQYRETGSTAYWLDIGQIITSYTDGIANIFQSVTNFELFGINIAGVFGAIIAVLVLAFVVSLLLKLFGLLI